MPFFAQLSLFTNIGIFLAAAVVIAVFGTRMTRLADELADATGLGEAITGAIFLGGTTSLSGLTTSVTAAANGHAELAISNAVGGIAAQTVFLAMADMAYRKINLEHAAASATNLMHGALLIALLSLPVLAITTADVSVLGVHPASIFLVAAYLAGLRLIAVAKAEPMWWPQKTDATRVDVPQIRRAGGRQLIILWLRFLFLAAIVGVAGYFVAKTAIAIARDTAISQTVMGGMFTAVTTSLPELVTSVAAVRQRALTLAIGGIIGGNCFDVLFVAFSDFAFREGSIYARLTDHQMFIIGLTILFTGILLLGMLRREKHGIGNIGFESFLIIVLYVGGFVFLVLHG